MGKLLRPKRFNKPRDVDRQIAITEQRIASVVRAMIDDEHELARILSAERAGAEAVRLDLVPGVLAMTRTLRPASRDRGQRVADGFLAVVDAAATSDDPDAQAAVDVAHAAFRVLAGGADAETRGRLREARSALRGGARGESRQADMARGAGLVRQMAERWIAQPDRRDETAGMLRDLLTVAVERTCGGLTGEQIAAALGSYSPEGRGRGRMGVHGVTAALLLDAGAVTRLSRESHAEAVRRVSRAIRDAEDEQNPRAKK